MTTISHSVFLPFELCQPIIDNLSDDWAALHACSLTCRAFLHASRYHIFHSIALINETDAIRFLDIMDSPTGPCAYVRILSMYEWEYPHLFQFADAILPFLAACLPNVTSLILRHLDWAPENDTWAKILSGFPKVEHLTLHVSFETSQQANEFISSFPLLQTLTFWVNASWKSYSEPVIPLPRSLKSIDLQSNQFRFFNRLLHLESHQDISSLSLEGMYLEDTQVVNELLKTLGSRLEHLRLAEAVEKAGTLATAVRGNLIDFTHNTDLRSLGLGLPQATWRHGPSLEWVSTLFSQITSDHMERVSFQMPPKGGFGLQVVLPLVERIFTQQHWSNLRQLEITIFGDPNVGQMVRASARAHMPVLYGRGIVLIRDWC